MQNRPYKLQRQWREFVLFEEIVQILFEHLKHQTRVVLVLKALKRPDEIEFVRILLAETRQNRNFYLALARVRWMILQNFDGDYVVSAAFPALDHLTECAATEELEHLRNKYKIVIKYATQSVQSWAMALVRTSYSADSEYRTSCWTS